MYGGEVPPHLFDCSTRGTEWDLPASARHSAAGSRRGVGSGELLRCVRTTTSCGAVERGWGADGVVLPRIGAEVADTTDDKLSSTVLTVDSRLTGTLSVLCVAPCDERGPRRCISQPTRIALSESALVHGVRALHSIRLPTFPRALPHGSIHLRRWVHAPAHTPRVICRRHVAWRGNVLPPVHTRAATSHQEGVHSAPPLATLLRRRVRLGRRLGSRRRGRRRRRARLGRRGRRRRVRAGRRRRRQRGRARRGRRRRRGVRWDVCDQARRGCRARLGAARAAVAFAQLRVWQEGVRHDIDFCPSLVTRLQLLEVRGQLQLQGNRRKVIHIVEL